MPKTKALAGGQMIRGVALAVCCLSIGLAGSAQEVYFDQSFPLKVDSVTIHGRGGLFGIILAAAVSSDGGVYVADYSNRRVVALGADGEVRWTTGGEGVGPGEFQLVYRLSVDADGTVHVLDQARGDITTLSADGAFLDRARLQFQFRQIDALVVLPEGGYAMSGVTDYGDGVRDRGVHIFDRELEPLRSFGPLPVADNRAVLGYWGAGAVTLTNEGELLYARRGPYEIYRYTTSGDLINVIEAPFELEGSPEDAIKIDEAAGRLGVSRGDPVDRPMPAQQLGHDRVIGGRLLADGQKLWDIFSEDGALVASTPVPNGWNSLVGFDPQHRVFWVAGESGLEPVMRRVFVSWRASENIN
ncbi:MAG: hypothetical protein MJB57_00345 [Gemmatimonadetes bacterium]|nr:hypothetical protein [Gemmatimonadota bacterium]